MTDIQQLTMFKQRDVERQFAACVFIDPVSAVQQCGWLSPEIILNPQVSKFWRGVRNSIQPGTEFTAANEISTTQALEAGLLPEIIGWSNDVTYSQISLPYANEIARRAYMTAISAKLGDLARAVGSGDDDLTRDVIRQMAAQDVKVSTVLPTALDVASQFEKIVTEDLRSVKFYLSPMDKATGGMERQTLTILAARPSIGKTALAWQIARSAAYAQKRVLFISLEMSSVNLWGRAACPQVETTWRDVRAGKLSKDQKERLVEESYKLAMQFEDKLMVIDTPQTTETIWQLVSEHRPELVIVDHLRLVKDTHTSEVKRQGMITQRLKEIAKNFQCAVLLCAQLNRQSETRASSEKRPILADIRDSGEIEENGDLILMMHRETFEGNIKPEKSMTEIWLRKFRDGPRDVLVKLWFDPKSEWFEEVDR